MTDVKWLISPEHPEGIAVPLTDEEIAQRQVDKKAAVELEAAFVAEYERRAAIHAKLVGGKATSEEVQAAVAELFAERVTDE